MDSLEIFVFLLVVFLFVLPIVAMVRANRARRRAKEVEEHWSQLTIRVYALEQEIKALKASLTPPVVGEVATPIAPQPGMPSAEPSLGKPVPRRSFAGVSPPPAHAAPLPEPIPVPRLSEAEVSPSVTPPPFAPVSKLGPSFGERIKALPNIEEVLGTNWLNKLGVIILVLGVAFFLAYQVRTLGPAGKVLLGYVVSAAMLGGGVFLERRDRYRILARAAIGGGWAFLFFTAYAMYHVEAARVLHSQAVDLVLLLVVAAAMVAHTLNYRSQAVTGLAFLLAFSTVTISRANVYSLSASAILALALVVIVGRMRWFELEVLGLVATYLNHYFWLRPIIEPMLPKRHPFPEFTASTALLLLYWSVFRASYIYRRIVEAREEGISTVAALLNTCLLLAVMKYQSVRPELAFWFLLSMGAVEMALSQLPVTRRRRAAFVVLSTLGSALLVAAFPFRYSGEGLSVLWLAEAEALFLAGVFTREIVFRRLGMLAAAVVSGQMLSVDAARVLGWRMADVPAVSEARLGVIFGVAAAMFYANAHWVSTRWAQLFETSFERLCFRRLSYVAGVMAFVGAWVVWPKDWTAVAWSMLALGAAFSGNRLRVRELSVQANLLGFAAIVRVLLVNLGSSGIGHHVKLRLITVGTCAILLYLCSRWSGISEFVRIRRFSAAYTWAGSVLLALLAWYELRPISVALAWTLFGLLLFELGLERKSAHLRLQAYVALAASFFRLFFVNLNAQGLPGEVSPRVYTTVPLAVAFFYVYWRLKGRADESLQRDRSLKAPQLFSFLSTLTLAALMRFESDPDWVVAAWAALTLVLVAFAWRTERRIFLAQAIFLGFAVVFRTVLHNFYQRSYFPAPFWHGRFVCVGSTVALLFLVLPFAFRLRLKPGAAETEKGNWVSKMVAAMDHRPEQIFFFTPSLLLTVLLALEMRRGLVTLAWGVEAVAVFLLALRVGERSFRLSGLALLLLCVAKIIVVDVWGLGLRDRYLTFIGLGIALLLVSTLYTRHRETLRQYL